MRRALAVFAVSSLALGVSACAVFFFRYSDPLSGGSLRSDDFVISAFFFGFWKSEGGAYRFSIRDFGDGKSALSMKDVRERRMEGISEGSLMQGFCTSPFSSWAVVVWWMPWAVPGSAKAFAFGNDLHPLEIADSSEFRFRDCGFGSSSGERFFAAVTHGSGTLYVRSLDSWKAWTVPSWFVSKSVSARGIALSHFLEFADIDHDGSDEIYFTVTSPFENVPWSVSETADGALYRAEFIRGEWSVADVSVPWSAYARRLKTVRSDSGDQLLAVYEGIVDDNGTTVTPVRLYRYSSKSWHPAWDAVLELPWHRECKTLTNFHTAKNSVQIGCDGAILYEIETGSGSYAVTGKRSFFSDSAGMAERGPDWSRPMPWETRSIHAVLWKDWDGDGIDELVVWVNNDGLYYVDPDSPAAPKKIPFDLSDAASGGSKRPTFLIMDAVTWLGSAETMIRTLVPQTLPPISK